MLYLEKRKIKTAEGTSARYYIRGTCPYTGESVRESTKTSDRGQASDILAIRLEQRRKRGLHGDTGSSTFAECVIHYLNMGGEDRFLDPILDALGKKTMGEITDKLISDLAGKLYPKAKPSTIVRQVYGPIEAVWNKACEAEPPMALPRAFQKPKVDRAPPKYAKTDNHLEKVLKAIPLPARRAGILFMSFSGRRASEVANVLVEDHDPARAVVVVGKTKNGKPIEVALPAFVNEIIARLDRDDPKARLFGFQDRFALYGEVKRASKRAKVEFLSPHKIGRHTFAARFLRNGNSLAALKEAGGWKSVNAVMVYAHLEQRSVDEAIRNVATPLKLEKPAQSASQFRRVRSFPKVQSIGKLQ